MKLDSGKLEMLLSQDKKDEARELIKDFLNSPLDKDELGRAILDLTSIYMDFINGVNEKYLEFLKESLDSLNKIKKMKESVRDQMDIEKVREDLASQKIE